MTDYTIGKSIQLENLSIGIAWCLAWGNERQPQFELSILQQMRQALILGEAIPEEVRSHVEQVKKLNNIAFPEKLTDIQKQYSDLWEQTTRIGLVYGGATKIKQYVFEAAKLPDIRGASGLLDRINLVDLPAFFGAKLPEGEEVREWLREERNFPELTAALIPELIIYSTGGNILAFCPAAFVDDLANAIEKRYTEQTLTANSCAVGDTFKLLEIRLGLLRDTPAETPWLDWYRKSQNQPQPLVQAYFHSNNQEGIDAAFKERKNFNELAGKLAAQFNQRRNGNDFTTNSRPTRRYPPMLETHPYLRRDAGDRRSAIFQATDLPGQPWFSEALIRKRLVSELAKNKSDSSDLEKWYSPANLDWKPGAVETWVSKFKQFLYKNPHRYYENIRSEPIHVGQVKEAKSVREISNASKPQGFVAYIYADGNNMGGYIQKKIQSPERYQQFSEDIFQATENSVYEAIAQHLKPHELKGLTDPDNENRNGKWIHPFEIITIGGDDVMLIVPADKALAIAKTIGEEFERQLMQPDKQRRYATDKIYQPQKVHRYVDNLPDGKNQCELSMSIGVLITAENTPIYYAEKLTSQLLKSAKKRTKDLKEYNYYSGNIDFLVMKSVTMISSNIGDFRSEGLIKAGTDKQKFKLYASPYTLHEIGGLLATGKAFKQVKFPRSQLYQIRGLLERGKRTAILNYRYFRVRLQEKHNRDLLENNFEKAWCNAQTNDGNLAPWMFVQPKPETGKTEKSGKYPASKSKESTYETIWRELVDLYPFIEEPEDSSTPQQQSETGVNI